MADIRDPPKSLPRNFLEFRKGQISVLTALEMICLPPTLNFRILEIKVVFPLEV